MLYINTILLEAQTIFLFFVLKKKEKKMIHTNPHSPHKGLMDLSLIYKTF